MTPKARTLLAVSLTIFLDVVGFGVIIPVLPLYARRLGASAFEVGLLTTLFSLGQFVAAPFWGRLSDRIGRRPVLVWTVAASALVYVYLGFAGTLALLYVGRALAGAFAGNIAAAQALISDITTIEERPKGMALVGMAVGLGFTIGPAIGAFAAWAGGVRAPFFAAAGLALLNVVACYRWLPASRPRDRELGGLRTMDLVRTPGLALVVLANFIIMVAFAGLETTMVVFGASHLGWDERMTGLVFTAVGVCIAFDQIVLLRVVAGRVGDDVLVSVGMTLMAAGAYLFPFVGSLASVGGWAFLLALGVTMCGPPLMSYVSKVAPPDRQGEAFGILQGTGALGRIVGPAGLGVAYDELGARASFDVASATLLAAAALFTATAWSRRGTPTAR